jgi:hypothetical protein
MLLLKPPRKRKGRGRRRRGGRLLKRHCDLMGRRRNIGRIKRVRLCYSILHTGHRGRADEAVDLLAPNLNKEKMQYKAQLERENQKSSAQMRKDRDKAALDKQR